MIKPIEEPRWNVKEVAPWSEPTRTLVFTDCSGVRRLRVEMLASDVTAESLGSLTALLGEIEEANPIAPSNGDSSTVLKLVM